MTTPMRVPPSEPERERAAELLQKAAGDGQLTLEQFSVRVGAVWAAESADELAKATEGLGQAPIVGSASTVDKVVTVFSDNKRRGRWRLRTPRLKVFTLFGSTTLDLREVLTGAEVIEIEGTSTFGEFKVIVPEGVEVDLNGTVVFSNRTMHLAAVPRVAGTPEIRIHLTSWFSNVEIVSQPYTLPPA